MLQSTGAIHEGDARVECDGPCRATTEAATAAVKSNASAKKFLLTLERQEALKHFGQRPHNDVGAGSRARSVMVGALAFQGNT